MDADSMPMNVVSPTYDGPGLTARQRVGSEGASSRLQGSVDSLLSYSAQSATNSAKQRQQEHHSKKHYAAEHLEERTFDGAYTRTSLNAIATGILIYRVFYTEFAPIAIAYLVFGGLFWFCAVWRRWSIRIKLWRFVGTDEEVPITPDPPIPRATADTQRLEKIKRALDTVQEVRNGEHGRVTIPASISDESLPDAYFAWRAGLARPPVPPVFETSGKMVLVTAFLTAALGLTVLIWLLAHL